MVKTVKLDDGSTAVFVVTRSRVGDQRQPAAGAAAECHAAAAFRGRRVAAYVNEAKRKVKIVKNPKVFEY